MRMQNTDMEFVTFDAKDIIATSGPNYNLTMKARVGAVVEYNYHVGSFCPGTNQISKDDGKSLYQSEPKDKGYDMGGFVNLDPNEYRYFNVDEGSLNLRTKDTQPSGNEFYVADTAEAITAWLNAHGAIQ